MMIERLLFDRATFAIESNSMRFFCLLLDAMIDSSCGEFWWVLSLLEPVSLDLISITTSPSPNRFTCLLSVSEGEGEGRGERGTQSAAFGFVSAPHLELHLSLPLLPTS